MQRLNRVSNVFVVEHTVEAEKATSPKQLHLTEEVQENDQESIISGVYLLEHDQPPDPLSPASKISKTSTLDISLRSGMDTSSVLDSEEELNRLEQRLEAMLDAES